MTVTVKIKIAVVVFQDLTLLDLVGFTDALYRLQSMQFISGLEMVYCAEREGISDLHRFRLPVDQVRPDLSGFDVLFIPGGRGTRRLIGDSSFISWIRSAAAVPLKVSVCTGSLIFGAAGFLDQKKATTHFDNYHLLSAYTPQVIRADVVQDQDMVTGGAVAASLVTGIHTCKILAGEEAARSIARSMGIPDLYQHADVQIY